MKQSTLFLILGGVIMATIYGKKWTIPAKGMKYAHLFEDAESHNGLPHNLLARVAYQESRFRDDIISGETVSGAGAKGIMQIVPKWHPHIDPLDVEESIYYAANYLRKLHRKFKTWPLALAAYNWGQGNVKKWLESGGDLDDMPKETRNYISQISMDVW